MDTKSRLMDFFEAENKRDWATYRKFLAADVVWTLHANHVKTVCGIDEYISTIIGAYKNHNQTFICEALYQKEEGNRIITILKNDLGERSCDIFEFKDGLIYREYEFIIG